MQVHYTQPFKNSRVEEILHAKTKEFRTKLRATRNTQKRVISLSVYQTF